MNARRRGLTVIELVIIIVVIVVAAVLLMRMRGRSAPDAADAIPPAADSAILAPPGAGNALAARIVVVSPLDSTARAGDTLDVRLRVATESGTSVSRATVTLDVTAGGGVVVPTSAVTSDLGEVEARWVLGGVAGEQSLRATVDGAASTTVRVTASPAAGAGSP